MDPSVSLTKVLRSDMRQPPRDAATETIPEPVVWLPWLRRDGALRSTLERAVSGTFPWGSVAEHIRAQRVSANPMCRGREDETAPHSRTAARVELIAGALGLRVEAPGATV
ncbi:hypothetical protein GCM10009826_41490 [Humibacillus xanthopallidus]